MAPAILHSGVSVSAFLHQQWRTTCPGGPHMSVTRISTEPANGHAKSTCRKANAIPLAEKIIIHDDNYGEGGHKLKSGPVPSPVSASVEKSVERHDGLPLKKRTLVFIPVSNDLTGVELTWHAKKLANLLRSVNTDCDKSAQKQPDFTHPTPRVHIARAEHESAEGLQFETNNNNNKHLVRSHLESTQKSGPDVNEVPHDRAPLLSNSGVNEVSKCTLTERHLSTKDSPPAPDHSDQQRSTAPYQNRQAVNERPPSPCKAAASDYELQPRESKNFSKKPFSKTKNFDFTAIAENLDDYGCISFTNAPSGVSSNEEAQEECVSQVLTQHRDFNAATNLKVVIPCKSNSSDSIELEKSEKGNLKVFYEAKIFESKAVAEDLDVAVGSAKIGSRLSSNGERGDCIVKLLQTEPDNCKVPVKIASSKTRDVECNVSNALRLSIRDSLSSPAQLGSHECVKSSKARTRCYRIEEAHSENVSQVPAGNDSYIPTVVQEYAAEISLNPVEISSKRKNKKRQNTRRKRARTELAEPSPEVTEYTSFIGWAGGKVIVCRPKASKEEGASGQEKSARNEAVCAENKGSRVISVKVENEGRVWSQQERAGGSISAGNPSASRASRVTDGCSDSGVSPVSQELSDTDAAEALLRFNNSLYEKVAKTDTEVDDELGGKAEQVEGFRDSPKLGVSSGDLSNLDPEEIKDKPKISAGEAASRLMNNLNEMATNADCELDVGNLFCIDPKNTYDIPVSFVSYLRSLVRPEGFPDNPQMKFRCFVCSELFSCYADLEVHSVKIHFEAWGHIRNSYLRALVPHLPGGFLEDHPQLTYKCVFCSRLFSRRIDLDVHSAERHYGDNPYECPFCSARFENPFSYSTHLNEHIYRNDYPSYPCDACCASFSSQWQLDLHCQTHEPPSEHIVVDL